MLFLSMHIIHLLAVIVWIGGLAFITLIVFPLLKRSPEALDKVLWFQRIERRFAPLARVLSAVTGVTGFTMIFSSGWYKLLFTAAGIPLTFMLIVWLFWTVMLFGLEPLVVKRMLERLAKSGDRMSIEAIFARMNRLHWMFLLLSLAASVAGVLTVHAPRAT